MIVVGILAYLGLVAFLRISGKRTLSKLNAFDLVVTVALGSTLATILLSKDVSLAEGLVAFATLIGLQYIIAWSVVRSKMVSKAIKSEPTLLLYKGQILDSVLRKERVATEEILEVLRTRGVGSLGEVDTVVMETDGSFSVLKHMGEGGDSSVRDVHMQDGSSQSVEGKIRLPPKDRGP